MLNSIIFIVLVFFPGVRGKFVPSEGVELLFLFLLDLVGCP